MIAYMRRENRPFNHKNVVDGLAGKYGTALVKRTLARLAEEGTLKVKQYKKALIYVVNQDSFDKPSDEELAAMDVQIKELKEEISALDSDIVNLAGRNKFLNDQMSNEDLAADVERLREEAEAKRAKLESLQSSDRELLTEAAIDKLEILYRNAHRAWKKRKRMVKDCIDLICDQSGKKPKDMMEVMGIETDEEVGVDYATLPPPTRPKKRQKTL